MIITINYIDGTEATVINTNSNITYASVVNLKITQEDGTLITDPQGRLLLEIQDSKKGQINIEDRVIFYNIYNAIRNSVGNIDNLTIADSTSLNILFSTKVLGYTIERVNLQDRGLTIEPIEYDNTNKSVCIQIILI
jgi:hypothetical protein